MEKKHFWIKLLKIFYTIDLSQKAIGPVRESTNGLIVLIKLDDVSCYPMEGEVLTEEELDEILLSEDFISNDLIAEVPLL